MGAPRARVRGSTGEGRSAAAAVAAVLRPVLVARARLRCGLRVRSPSISPFRVCVRECERRVCVKRVDGRKKEKKSSRRGRVFTKKNKTPKTQQVAMVLWDRQSWCMIRGA